MMTPASAPVAEPEEPSHPSEFKLRKQLLLLAALVVSVTYMAGLTPPAGVWQDDGPGVVAGGPILRITHRRRFLSFYYCNSTALAASLVVISLLLLLDESCGAQLAVLRLVMLLDLLALMGAYLAGSCRDMPATVYATALVLALSAYVGVHILQGMAHHPSPAALDCRVHGGEEDEEELRRRAAAAASSSVVLKPKERCKVLLLLATFTTGITYVAGLNPPGGFWDTLDDGGRRRRGHGGYRPGESLVEAHHRGHFRMFFYCNTTAFVASLFIIVLLLDKKLSERTARSLALNVFILSALLGLLAAYDAGSCRDTNCSVYVVSLFGAVLAFIFLTMVAIISPKRIRAHFRNDNGPAPESNNNNSLHVANQNTSPATTSEAEESVVVVNDGIAPAADTTDEEKAIKKVKSLVLLLSNLAATVTYQSGLDPPGGFWPDDGEGHRAGDAILLSKDPARYRAFFFCNSAAFVVSLVVILMVQNVRLVKSYTLLVAMMLDMFALIGAYAAGSCRDLRTSVHVVALAGAVLLYVLVHVLFFTLRPETTDAAATGGGERTVVVPEKKHKRLLLVAILVATITYQVGLTPPGGFWIDDNFHFHPGRNAGGAVLLDKYPRRFRFFLYCNTVSFMASIALVLLLVNPNLSQLAIQCYALYACQAAGLIGLMGAYAAGSARRLRTSIFSIVLVAFVIAFFAVNFAMFTLFKQKRTRSAGGSGSGTTPAAAAEQEPNTHTPRDARETQYRDEVYAKRKYLMLLGILAASVTYQAGLAPPGGVWQDDGGSRREAGNPVLHDTDLRRYHVFFYSNSTSFVASIVVIALLLQQILRRHRPENHELLLLATNTAIVLDLLGLLAAYAAGSTREWRKVAVLPVIVLILMAIHAAVWLFGERRRRCRGSEGVSTNGRTEEHVVNGHDQPSSHAQDV